MTEHFCERLRRRLDERGPLCAGIDPSPAALAHWGLADSAQGAAEFALRYLDALAETVAVMKPNVAFFEQYGAAGMAALEQFVAAARDAGVLTILDAKRADIGSTNAAYARAWLDPSASLAGDALTVTPYLGVEALKPFFAAAAATGRGVFVVVRSSNPEGRGLQQAVEADGRSVEASLLDALARHPDGPGAVVGLIAGAAPLPLPEGICYLAPGLDSQGAGLDDLAAQFGGVAAPVAVNLSRALAGAGPRRGALVDAAARAQERIAGGLRPRRG